jgi:hypothetical protein
MLLLMRVVVQSGINKWCAKAITFVTVRVESMIKRLIRSSSTIPNSYCHPKHDKDMHNYHLYWRCYLKYSILLIFLTSRTLFSPSHPYFVC